MVRFYNVIIILSLLLTSRAFADTPQSLAEIDDVVHQFVQHTLREHYGEQYGEQGDYNINIGHLDPRLTLEQCTQPLTPILEYGQISQHNFTIKVSCSSPKTWSVRLPVKIQVFKKVVVNKQHISREQPINGVELDLARQDVSQIGDGYYESIDDLAGLVAQRNIASGSVIKQHMVKQPTLVHRGQMVKMVIEAPGLTIEGSGVAQTDGVKGQLVKVKNVRSNKVVDATVVDVGITVIPI